MNYKARLYFRVINHLSWIIFLDHHTLKRDSISISNGRQPIQINIPSEHHIYPLIDNYYLSNGLKEIF